MTVEVPGRINTKGQVIKPFDAPLLRERLQLLKKHELDAITISLINSFANSAHEVEAMKIAQEMFPGGKPSVFRFHLTSN